jgi:hypothetical protein
VDRRRFLELLGIGGVGIALEQAIPFGRVWSFPKEIVIAQQVLPIPFVTQQCLNVLEQNLGTYFFLSDRFRFEEKNLPIGSLIL